LNLLAGAGALLLSRPARVSTQVRASARRRQQVSTSLQPPQAELRGRLPHVVTGTCVALMLSGFAAMGMEIVWLRHFNLLLGGFRAVFSLALTIMLAGIGTRPVVRGLVHSWLGRPGSAP